MRGIHAFYCFFPIAVAASASFTTLTAIRALADNRNGNACLTLTAVTTITAFLPRISILAIAAITTISAREAANTPIGTVFTSEGPVGTIQAATRFGITLHAQAKDQ